MSGKNNNRTFDISDDELEYGTVGILPSSKPLIKDENFYDEKTVGIYGEPLHGTKRKTKKEKKNKTYIIISIFIFAFVVGAIVLLGFYKFGGSSKEDDVVIAEQTEIVATPEAAPTSEPEPTVEPTPIPTPEPTPTPIADAPQIKITNEMIPSVIKFGNFFNLKGIVSVDKGTLSEIIGKIIDEEGNEVMTAQTHPYSDRHDIQYTINNLLVFSTLDTGTYTIEISATAQYNNDSFTQVLVDSKFNVR